MTRNCQSREEPQLILTSLEKRHGKERKRAENNIKFSARGQGKTEKTKTEDEAITKSPEDRPSQAPTRPRGKRHLPVSMDDIFEKQSLERKPSPAKPVQATYQTKTGGGNVNHRLAPSDTLPTPLVRSPHLSRTNVRVVAVADAPRVGGVDLGHQNPRQAPQKEVALGSVGAVHVHLPG